MDVRAFEIAARRVLELGDEGVDAVWSSVEWFGLRTQGEVDAATPEEALEKLAWLELQLRKWTRSDATGRAAMEAEDALPAVYSFWKPIGAFGGGSATHYDARRFGAFGLVIARLMRERALAAGWLPHPCPHLAR